MSKKNNTGFSICTHKKVASLTINADQNFGLRGAVYRRKICTQSSSTVAADSDPVTIQFKRIAIPFKFGVRDVFEDILEVFDDFMCGGRYQ